MGRKAMMEVERLEKSIEEYFALCDSINAAASEKSGKKRGQAEKAVFAVGAVMLFGDSEKRIRKDGQKSALQKAHPANAFTH